VDLKGTFFARRGIKRKHVKEESKNPIYKTVGRSFNTRCGKKKAGSNRTMEKGSTGPTKLNETKKGGGEERGKGTIRFLSQGGLGEGGFFQMGL